MDRFRMTADGLETAHTSLRDAPSLAALARVGRVVVKMESERPFGNFKVLGGMYAGIRMLADAAGTSPEAVMARHAGPLPALVCASDGNHGVAVAAAARAAGSQSIVYLHRRVSADRAERIRAQGALIRWIDGTYDDAVAAARAGAGEGLGVLVPDTGDERDDPVVRMVMKGYGAISRELVVQLPGLRAEPTHLFVQAGVGGLAAGLVEGLSAAGRPPGRIVVVEPASAACVAQALRTGRVERVAGDLGTAAEMLSCGLASAYAVEVLGAVGACSVLVSEEELDRGRQGIERHLSTETTASGAAGLAGLLSASRSATLRRELELTARSTVLLLVTEGA